MSSKDTVKSKEVILAEREAKRLAKQNVKSKTTDSSLKKPAGTHASAPVTAAKTETPKDVSIKPRPMANNVPPKVPARGKDEVDRAIKVDIKIKPEVVSVIDGEKTREQVKAEREAKKLAKQQVKKKVVASGDTATPQVNKEGLKTETAGHVKNITAVVEILKLDSEKVSKPEETIQSKTDLKAERRAKQEAQRAAKELAAKKALRKVPEKSSESVPDKSTRSPVVRQEPKPTQLKQLEKGKPKSMQSVHKVNWFQHLYAEREAASSMKIALNSRELHPSIVRLGVQLASRVVVGSNARCIALLDALKDVVTDYTLPAKTEFGRGLEKYLTPCLSFLWAMRPPSASMTNAVKHFRWQLTQLDNNVNELLAKSTLKKAIDTYVKDQIDVAGEAISIAVRNKISNGDNILTYGCSSLIEKILKDAWTADLKFHAVVVGSRSCSRGKEMLRRLIGHGIPCTYINITAINFLMRTINKVLLGAGSLLVNGSVLSAAGTAQVALAARAYNVPVLVCCETHKFSERVQTDAFVFNEIGNPDDLVQKDEHSPLKDWRSYSSLTPLNLAYDVTPPGLVTAVVTELAVVPCTSAPVILRFKLPEYGA